MSATKLNITGKKYAMVPYGLRLPRAYARILNRTARANKCRGADLLRTAWQEYVINHSLPIEEEQ